MIRSLAAIITGQLSIMLLSGLSRLAIGTYLETDLSLSGISYVPSFTLGIILTALSLIFGILGGLITCIIAEGNYKIEILSLSLLVLTVGLFDFTFISQAEPLWYFLANTGLTIAGIFLGYRITKQNNEILKISHH